MRATSRFLALWLVLGIACPAAHAAAESPHSSSSPSHDLPDYMRNWEFGVHAEDDTGFRYFADLMFPLHRFAAQHGVLFFEPRVSHVDRATLFNNGIGYRRLVRNDTWLLGVNTFYDYEALREHARVGFGGEALSAYAEARANGYLGISHTRTIQSDGATTNVERAVSGYDVEVGAPIPHYSRLKLFGGYEWYDFKKFKDREGWTVRAEYRPVSTMVLDLTYSDNTKRDPGFGVNIAFRPPIWDVARTPAVSPLRLDKALFPDSDVSDRVFSLVERHHEIVVESYSQAVGKLNIEIKRGT